DTFEDIVALVALYRPGPLESGMVEDFINRKHGRAKADYFHPELETALTSTYGVIVYQEQVMQIAQIIGGYSLGAADLLRRAMGKKNAEEMAQQRSIFVGGAVNRGINEKLATHLFDLMEKFAGYGFNKSHSAAYALVSYQTLYLKAHYPAAFMAATLSSDMDNTDKVHAFYLDTLAQGVNILPPDINSSEYRFTPIDEKTVAYGLGAIKGTGEAAISNILKAREERPFRDLFDFCRRVDKRVVNRRAVEALIRGGAFDSISGHRHQLLATLDAALGSAEQQARAANQNSLFGDDESTAMPVQLADVPRWPVREQLQNEKLSLGFYLSGHPYQEYAGELANFIKTRLSDLSPNLLPQQNVSGRRASMAVVLAGIVSGVRIQQTRRGRMGVVTLDDGSAQLEMTVFNEVFETSRPWIREDELLVVRGKASLDEYSGNMRISGEELFDFASARSTFAKHLELTVSAGKHISAARLKELLTPYRDGKCPVQVHYRTHDADCQLRFGEAWQVTLHDDLVRSLRDLLQAENVKVVYG
ncbi:MAG: DNA polymerase III subunit alpha, partial [Betaproteobacteria bacterium]|nr:DNA polymerase III subunit alpha [Betaproteobacteria bacterium]